MADTAHPREDVLQTASSLISGDRDETYGSPAESFDRIAAIWSALLGVVVAPAQVAMMLAGMKLARLAKTPAHADSWVDLAGYAALGGEVVQLVAVPQAIAAATPSPAEAHPVTRLSEDAAEALAAISAWVDGSNGGRDREALLLHRVIKVGEEFGEAISALIGWAGANPRKGVTNTPDDLIEELLDVAVAALGAVEHIDGNRARALGMLESKIIMVAERAVGRVAR